LSHEIGIVSPKQKLDTPGFYRHRKWALLKDIGEGVGRPLHIDPRGGAACHCPDQG
jgi:hypothetical protein